MNFPRKIERKKPNRDAGWRSPTHRNHVRGHECAMCFSDCAIEVAHVRMDTDGGMSKKPSDYFTVPLCKDCHQRQHTIGEKSFWHEYTLDRGMTVEQLMDAMCAKSPKAAEIYREKRERGQ